MEPPMEGSSTEEKILAGFLLDSDNALQMGRSTSPSEGQSLSQPLSSPHATSSLPDTNALPPITWAVVRIPKVWRRRKCENKDFKPSNILLIDEVDETTRYRSMPPMLSLGPRYRSERHLKTMEQHKERALDTFLKQSGKSYAAYMESMEGIARKLEDFYHRDQVKMMESADGTQFLREMILDGAFVLEILRLAGLVENPTLATGYAPNDPIFSSHGMLYTLPYIRRDMLILENQILLTVLEKMVAIQTGRSDGNEIRKEITTKLVNLLVPGIHVPSNIQGTHALDAVRNSLIGDKAKHLEESHPSSVTYTTPLLRSNTCHGQKNEDAKRQQMHLSSFKKNKIQAIRLRKYGIILKQSKTTDLMDISFKCGVLRLPSITIDDTTGTLLFNLMAFERIQHGCRGWELSSYVYFMGSLIQSAEDVRLLRLSGIIKTARGTDSDVANLFSNLFKGIDRVPDEYSLMNTHLALLVYRRKACPMRLACLLCTSVVCLAITLISVLQFLSIVRAHGDVR